MSLPSGTKLGPYEITGTLGAGGMGEVYRARDLRLERDVAVKVLPPHLASDQAALARFEREAKAVAALAGIASQQEIAGDGRSRTAPTPDLVARRPLFALCRRQQNQEDRTGQRHNRTSGPVWLTDGPSDYDARFDRDGREMIFTSQNERGQGVFRLFHDRSRKPIHIQTSEELHRTGSRIFTHDRSRDDRFVIYSQRAGELQVLGTPVRYDGAF